MGLCGHCVRPYTIDEWRETHDPAILHSPSDHLRDPSRRSTRGTATLSKSHVVGFNRFFGEVSRRSQAPTFAIVLEAACTTRFAGMLELCPHSKHRGPLHFRTYDEALVNGSSDRG
jgi:hypothetical protein